MTSKGTARKATKKRSTKATAASVAPPMPAESYEPPMVISSEADAEAGAGAESDAASKEGS
jgi:hypothetical protein